MRRRADASPERFHLILEERSIMSFDLVRLGWDDGRAAELTELQSRRGCDLTPGRVARVDRDAVTVLTRAGRLRAGSAGALRRAATAVAVGDWVALDGDVVVAVLSRRSVFERGDPGGESLSQLIAANVDTVFVVAPLVGRPRPRLLQRSLALAWQSGATPAVVLTKKDLCPDAGSRRAAVEVDAVGVDVHAVSAATGEGLAALDDYLLPGVTVAMIGPSGAGKSTLANALGGGSLALPTGDIRDDGKGRHTTTARELVVLPGGGVLIDTPGLRGLALWDAGDGIDAAFADVTALAVDCRFADCAHGGEPGCMVRRAIAEGDLDAARLADYQKLQREQRWMATRRDARARAEERAKAKAFHRQIRGYPHR
jgi:ribosome biogenesis GTPase